MIKPIREKIAVKRSEAMKQSAGGLFIPDASNEKPDQGTIIAMGSGKLLNDGTTVEPVVKVGDVIAFLKGAGQTVKVDGEEFVMIREEDILGIIS